MWQPGILALVAMVYLPMLAEARRATWNEAGQRARGGIEPPHDVYPIMRVAYPGAFAAMLVEGAVRGLPPSSAVALGLAVFGAGKALKWWAILSLGRAWTFRIIVVPGSTRVVTGPYRYLAHPNYVGVIGELAGVAIMAGALVSGPIATAAFGALILRRIAVERRTLDAILPRS